MWSNNNKIYKTIFLVLYSQSSVFTKYFLGHYFIINILKSERGIFLKRGRQSDWNVNKISFTYCNSWLIKSGYGSLLLFFYRFYCLILVHDIPAAIILSIFSFHYFILSRLHLAMSTVHFLACYLYKLDFLVFILPVVVME